MLTSISNKPTHMYMLTLISNKPTRSICCRYTIILRPFWIIFFITDNAWVTNEISHSHSDLNLGVWAISRGQMSIWACKQYPVGKCPPERVSNIQCTNVHLSVWAISSWQTSIWACEQYPADKRPSERVSNIQPSVYYYRIHFNVSFSINKNIIILITNVHKTMSLRYIWQRYI